MEKHYEGSHTSFLELEPNKIFRIFYSFLEFFTIYKGSDIW